MTAMNPEKRLARAYRWISLAFGGLILGAIALSYSEFCCRAVSRSAEWLEGLRGYGYPTTVAPVYLNPGRVPRLFWLDNDRVLFIGHTEEEYKRRGFASYGMGYTYSLLIWNVRSNTVQKLNDTVGGECYFDGFLTYRTQVTADEIVSKQGPIDRLVETRLRAKWSIRDLPDGEGASIFGCGTYRFAEQGPQGNCLVPLVRGDGFIDPTGGRCAPEAVERMRGIRESAAPERERQIAMTRAEQEFSERPVLYYRTLDSDPIALPIKSKEANLVPMPSRYAEWSRQYVVIADQPKDQQWLGSWPDKLAHPIYLISAGGIVQRIDMPWTPGNRGELRYAMPTRVGMAIVNDNIALRGGVGDAGLYLVKDGRLTRVARAYVTNLSVAPDGCNVAFGTESLEPPSTGRLRLVDVCRGEQR